MKYNQPYGAPGSNDPYVNGNPATGTMGSIPPAASIEYPQREIVNLISDVNLATPTDSDLHQLAKAVQSTLLYSDNDAGTANAYQVTQVPAPTAYFTYQTIVMKVLTTNTGPSTVNLNALGAKAIKRIDGTPLVASDLLAGSIVCLVYDGTNFQTVWSSKVAGAATGGGVMTANTNLYVNTTTGNDSTFDGTSATVGVGTVGPFKTIQRAVTEAFKFQASSLYTMTINVADGTYAENIVTPVTSGPTLIVKGNAATPANVHINCTTNGVNGFGVVGTNTVTLRDLKVSQTGTNAANVGASGSGANLSLINVEFGASTSWAVLGNGLGSVSVNGAIKFTANLLYGFAAYRNGTVNLGPSAVITISAAIVTSGFAFATSGGQIECTASPSAPSFVNPGNVTGTRYNASLNAVINTQGGGANFWPGTSAGTTATGGQYA